MSQKYRVGIIGFAHMHINSVAAQFGNHPQVEMVACADTVTANPELRDAPYTRGWNVENALSNIGVPKVYEDYQEMLEVETFDIVICCSENATHADVVEACAMAGVNVCVEKPMASSLSHALRMVRACQSAGTKMVINWPATWSPGIRKAKELIDQGVLLIDLARWFLGDFSEVDGFAHTYYWDMPVDDNAFMLLKTEDQRTAFLHVSCTEWKNTFSFELYGRNGKLQVDGLGGSYGVERLTWYKMLPEMGPPETVSWEYPMHDNSWQVEMNQFRQDIELGRQPQPGLTDAVAVLQIVESIYQKSGYDHRP